MEARGDREVHSRKRARSVLSRWRPESILIGRTEIWSLGSPLANLREVNHQKRGGSGVTAKNAEIKFEKTNGRSFFLTGS